MQHFFDFSARVATLWHCSVNLTAFASFAINASLGVRNAPGAYTNIVPDTRQYPNEKVRRLFRLFLNFFASDHPRANSGRSESKPTVDMLRNRPSMSGKTTRDVF